MRLSKLFLTVVFSVMPAWAGSLVLGVVPQQSPLKLIKTWTPIVDYLEAATGEKIELKIERSIPTFEKVLYSGGYDLAYMNPYHYTVAHKKQKYEAKVRADKKIVGILVASKKSGIKSVSDMKGKNFLFPAPYAFAATLLTKYELLNDHGIDVDGSKKLRYVNSHDSVYKGVARGIGDVGGGIERTFNNLSDRSSKEKLVIIYRTQSYPSHPLALKPTLSPALKAKLTQALLKMPPELLKALSIKRVIPTKDGEYDAIRDIAKKLLLKE